MKPSISYSILFTRHLGGSFSFTITRAGRTIHEPSPLHSSLPICRQKAYDFLCFSVDHFHDRNRFSCSEREVREGKRKGSQFFPIIDFENSNLLPQLLSSSSKPKSSSKPSPIPLSIADL